MPLNELHARRLATVVSLFEAALDRMELVLHSTEADSRGTVAFGISGDQARLIREKMAALRRHLHEGLRYFSVCLQRPEPKQMLIAELSTLWVILENARPQRMKGLGVEFSPQDKVAWEDFIQALMHDTESVRAAVRKDHRQA